MQSPVRIRACSQSFSDSTAGRDKVACSPARPDTRPSRIAGTLRGDHRMTGADLLAPDSLLVSSSRSEDSSSPLPVSSPQHRRARTRTNCPRTWGAWLSGGPEERRDAGDSCDSTADGPRVSLQARSAPLPTLTHITLVVLEAPEGEATVAGRASQAVLQIRHIIKVLGIACMQQSTYLVVYLEREPISTGAWA